MQKRIYSAIGEDSISGVQETVRRSIVYFAFWAPEVMSNLHTTRTGPSVVYQ